MNADQVGAAKELALQKIWAANQHE